ncbi:MAG: PepSY-associated TM helix domain-containing protein [Bacteroidota bacterium]
MKLKGLGNRAYNIIFHTHTVAGIVISFALFVIFYAGAFSLFRHEIYLWENQEARFEAPKVIDYDKALFEVDKTYSIDKHTIANVLLPNQHNPYIKVFGAFHDTDSTTKRIQASIDPKSYEINDLSNPKTTVGDTMYELHYFGQIPVVGLYISGFVALFFLFASITGLLIHWQNIFTKFFSFITEGKWKQIWTNAHTVLGMIGLPFQIMYAITGALFGLLTLLLLPSVLILFNGDTDEVFKHIRPLDAIELNQNAPLATNPISLNHFIEAATSDYPNHKVKSVSLLNYGLEDAIAMVYIDDIKGILSDGYVTFSMSDGMIVEKATTFPNEKTYAESVLSFLTKLHFGTFGGIFLKIIYFILSMITCFMIVSGILIWKTARENNNYTHKQKQFHHRVTKTYLAICLSMFPAFALLFIANKLVPMSLDDRAPIVEISFFFSWLCLTLIGLSWNSYAKLNKNYLLTGGILSLFVPIMNGAVTGDWFWITWYTFPVVAYVDIFWLFTGIISLFIVFNVLQVAKPENTPLKDIKQKIVDFKLSN